LNDADLSYCIDNTNKITKFKRNRLRQIYSTETEISSGGLKRSWENLWEDRKQREQSIISFFGLKEQFITMEYFINNKNFNFENFTLTEVLRIMIIDSVLSWMGKNYCNRKIHCHRAEFPINSLEKLATSEIKMLIDALNNAWGIPAVNFSLFKRILGLISHGKVQNIIKNRFLMIGRGRDKDQEYLVIRPVRMFIFQDKIKWWRPPDFISQKQYKNRVTYKKNLRLRRPGRSKKLANIFQEFGVSIVDRPYISIYKNDATDHYVDLVALNHIRSEWPLLKSIN